MNIFTQHLIDEKRRLLGIVLVLIGIVLVGGGACLLWIGGSAYYLCAGLAVCGAAWFVARGDRRGIWLYGAMLVVTLLWSLSETGLNIWGLQARLAAPLVLGIWVVAPMLKRWHAPVAVMAVVAALLLPQILTTLGGGDPASAATPEGDQIATATEWEHYGNDLGGSRFSQATQINRSTVSQLEPAWTHHTGVTVGMGFQATPIMVGETLYLCTANNIIIALDPDSGAVRWRFDPKVSIPSGAACRGVAYFRAPGANGACSERILSATTDARLLAVDAHDGRPCVDFGVNGSVDLKHRMDDVDNWYYYVSSAPLVADGKVVLGGWVMDGQHVGEPSGVIRAFDAVTGRFAWAWDMERPDFNGEPPEGETYSRGTPNSWGTMSVDPKLGLIYVPTGNSTPDYWGAHRSAASEKYSSSIVALESGTGRVRWSFQTVRHDLWDYDVAAQPTLIDLPIGGKRVPALIQATKQGQMFLLDRRTGEPLAKVEDLPVPQGAAPGDFVSPTQPFSTGLPAFENDRLSEATMWGLTPLDQLWCRITFRKARYEGIFTPPGLRSTITYPSFLGGIDWGGVSIDPERHLMAVNWNRMANYTRLVPRSEAKDVALSTNGGVHAGQPVPQLGTPFALLTEPFLSPLGVPCTEPPFGKIGVVDLNTRKLIWSRPLGNSGDSGPFGIRTRIPLPMGMPNLGGSLSTRGGLIFIAATQEWAIRAFDIESGKKLWSARLPAGGNATPMTYVSPKTGRQYVVIAAGGHHAMRSGRSDAVVAFALPIRTNRNPS